MGLEQGCDDVADGVGAASCGDRRGCSEKRRVGGGVVGWLVVEGVFALPVAISAVSGDLVADVLDVSIDQSRLLGVVRQVPPVGPRCGDRAGQDPQVGEVPV